MAASINVNNGNLSSPGRLLSASNESPGNAIGPAHTVSTRNYTLDINRALKRKLQGCKLVNVDYEMKAGGVTGTLDTASFELFRLACTEFFRSLPPEQGRCVTDFSEDKRKYLVQQTYRITSAAAERLYTLNLYPTNSTMLLNGKFYPKFIEDHLPVIHQIMCRAVQDENLGSVANLNEVLGSQLQKVLDERMHLNDAHDSPSRAPSPSVPRTDQSSEPPSLNESNDKKEDDVQCLVDRIRHS